MKRISPHKIKIGQIYKVVIYSKFGNTKITLIERRIKPQSGKTPPNCIYSETLNCNPPYSIDKTGFFVYGDLGKNHNSRFYSLTKEEIMIELI